MNEPLKHLAVTLRNKGYSLTKPRRELFLALLNQEPLSVDQLIARVHHDRSSIYRNITIFIESGIIHRLPIGWKYKLELSDEFSTHHHHATCQECGTVITLDEEPGMESMINLMAVRSGFKPKSHQLELIGSCKSCIKNDPGQ